MTGLRSRLPPPARALLERAGVTDAELEPLLRWEGDGLVLVGSAAEGFLTPESDLDFLVLREESEPLDEILARRGLGEEVGQRSTLVDRILALVEGVEIDVWILARDRFAALEETLARSVDPDGRIRSLPGLQYLEQKALSRLHGAVPLYGEEALARWRAALRVERLPAITAAQMLVEALSYLEDAAALLGQDEELGSSIATRAAGERLVQGALAAHGVVGWDLRYAGLHRGRLPYPGAVLERLENLLFPPRPLDAGAALDHALDAAEALLGEVDRNAADYVRAFGEGRWKLPRDVLRSGWRPHPDAVDDHATSLPVEPGRVVGLGAICDLRPQRSDDARSQSFSISEFVTLEDGRRVILHEDRGFTIGWSGDLGGHETLESMTRNVLNVVLPDDDECAEDHPWSWLADLARARGLDVTAEDLRGLPYEVILTDEVRRWLAPA